MATYSKDSLKRLKECHPDIQRVFFHVLQKFDHSIICGHRGKEEQDDAVAKGRSKTPFPTSKHNRFPSLAIDAMPFPVEWEALEKGDDLAVVRMGLFAGYVLGVAEALGVDLKWGGDWDGDFETRDQTFNDWPHFELRQE